jgi:hypothetical protein
VKFLPQSRIAVCYHVRKNPPLIPILHHIKPAHILSVYLSSGLILFSHLHLDLQSGSFLLIKTLYGSPLCPMRATCHVILILLELITLTMRVLCLAKTINHGATSSCSHRASIHVVSKTLFIVPNDAHYYKIVEMLKQFKNIITLAPTCFGSRRNHHQGAVLCLAKTTNMILLCTSV